MENIIEINIVNHKGDCIYSKEITLKDPIKIIRGQDEYFANSGWISSLKKDLPAVDIDLCSNYEIYENSKDAAFRAFFLYISNDYNQNPPSARIDLDLFEQNINFINHRGKRENYFRYGLKSIDKGRSPEEIINQVFEAVWSKECIYGNCSYIRETLTSRTR